ncbi:hypothetical protein CASFOL_011663 [Castilleja foliolosa]|uniref:Uncharacterized protein n=1 Tax=Castilleja foliolosa TaxID=1961234 RepID=A0ABD3DW64_9LAMI
MSKYVQNHRSTRTPNVIKKNYSDRSHSILLALFRWPGHQPAFAPLLDFIRHIRPKNPIPHHKKRLRKVILIPIQLMMYIVISRVVLKERLEKVAGQPKPAVVVDRLEGCEREEENGSPWGHSGNEEREGPTDRVEEDTFERVVVQGSKGVGNDETVVLRVDVLVEELVVVHVAMHEVLPGVQDRHGDDELAGQDDHGRFWRLWGLGIVCGNLQGMPLLI